jgi:6-phosphogluconolactonase
MPLGIMNAYTRLAVSIFCLALLTAVETAVAAVQGSESGMVYVMTNKTKANSVLVYQRATDGTLTFVQESPTKGLGTGATQDPLMSQGALTLCPGGKVLLAVNPASGELSAFRVTAAGLELGSKVLSGGAFPVSVTASGGFAYVVNQLGIPNISGFTVNISGQLQPIPNSTRELAGDRLLCLRR